MKSWAALLLLVPCLADLPHGKTKVNDLEHIALLNTDEARTWTAASQKIFAGMNFDGARRFLGVVPANVSVPRSPARDKEEYAMILKEDVPADFDARAEWPGLIQPVRTQKRCGSCWALSAADVLADRISIAQGVASVALSPEDMARCSGLGGECVRHGPSAAWNHLTTVGVATESCVPSTVRGGRLPRCSTKCSNKEPGLPQRVRAGSLYAILGAGNMQKDLMIRGPIQAAFNVYKSFLLYSSGVYRPHWWETEPEGSHAVRILGWGTSAQHRYWQVANSWGEKWGENGYFRIFRGDTSCGLEKLGPPQAGLPEAVPADFQV